MHADYQSSILKELRDQQVRYAPREKKVEQINRAERLLEEIDPSKTYSYEYLCYRITDYRPDAAPSRTMPGAQARHDLRLFVEDVSDAADLHFDEAGEPVHTVDDLSRIFNVSTKTISRWRGQGLVGRRFLVEGRKRVGFLKSSVDRFVAKNRDRIERGERFSQVTPEERDLIIDRARRLAQTGGCPTEIARRVARQMNRSAETIRYTIKQFDDEHPDLAVFPDRLAPLRDEQKERLYQQYRRGMTVEALAKKYRRTRGSIYRIVNEMRARKILELPIDYLYNPEFDRPGAEQRILGERPHRESGGRKKTRAPSGLPPYLASLYETPLLTGEEEQYLFRKLNYLKHRIHQMRSDLDPQRARATQMDEIEQYYAEAAQTKNELVQANLRLVVSIAKRHVTPSHDFFSLVSDGNISLIRAVEKFDYSRGFKFSTYASWAIMKNFARSIPDEFKHQDRFRTSLDEMFMSQPDDRSDQYEQEQAQRMREEQVHRILSRLDEREQRIIISRFGLDHQHEPLTLKEVGEDLGVTKERVRQLEARALDKLRVAAEEERLDVPE
jgi:RNA polymerase primary sigma factor/RNA polymerase sigma factor